MATTTRDPLQPPDALPRLLRMYPAPWRDRYGAEVADLLAARPPTTRDRIDIVLGAIDARLNPQGGRNRRSRTVARRDGILALGAVAAGGLFTTWATIIVAATPRWDALRSVDQGLIAASYAAGLLGALIAAAVLLGMAVRHVDDLGAAGFLGAMVAAGGFLLFGTDSGTWAITLVCLGTLLMSAGLGRAFGWATALLMVVATCVVAAMMFGFVGGGRQETSWLWLSAVYGPSWIVLGAGLRNGARIQSSALVGA